jgi:5,10-methylenetetrahydromethanopterin reductase
MSQPPFIYLYPRYKTRGFSMKFGFGANPSEHYQDFIELIQYAENLGFDYAWVPDQTFYRDPFVILGILALSTKQIQLGIGVTNPYTRHPAMIARSIGTIDEMAPGRIHLGIGAGNNKELLRPLGFDGLHAGEKCREMVEVVRALLSGVKVEYKGQYFLVDGIKLDFSTNPNIPIYIAGRGPYVLQAAGEVADGAIVGGLCTASGISYAKDQIRIGSAKSGQGVRRMELVSWVTCIVTEDREKALEDLKPLVAHIIGGAPEIVLEAVGLDPTLVSKIKTVYHNQGIPQAAKHITKDCIDAFTIVGDAAECVRHIKELEKAGITQLSMLVPSGTMEQSKQNLQRFAQSVIPNLR